MKVCNCCQQEKPLTEFYLRRDKAAGHRHICIACWRAKNALRPKSWRPACSPEERKARRIASMQKYKSTWQGKAKHRLHSANRRAAKLRATPSWLTPTQLAHIACYYDTAAGMSALWGIQMDVDHVIPLQGKDVCGLHVPWNMQIMEHVENSRKNNKL